MEPIMTRYTAINCFRHFDILRMNTTMNRCQRRSPIDHFTVSCLVAWPLNESEAEGDLVLIETSLLFSF